MAHGIEEEPSGQFGLCIFDAESTSDQEIHDVFEKFGQLANMNRTKNLTFIRYSSLEEAVQCYEEMKGQSRFRVKPARKKGYSDKPGSRDRFDDHSRGREMNFRKNESDNSNRARDIKQPAMRPMPNLKFDMPQECAAVTAPAVSEHKACRRVTVGHLHPDMKQCDVYTLCSKARAPPVHIDMKSFTRQPYPPAYYAIVYLKSEADVQNIVRGLNNLKLNGYQLIVAPYEKLIEEGKTSLC